MITLTKTLTHFNKLLRTFMLFQFLRVFRLKKQTNKKKKTERHATCAWYLPADLIRPRTCLNEVDEKVTWPHKCSVDFFTDTHRLNDSTTMQCEKLWWLNCKQETFGIVRTYRLEVSSIPRSQMRKWRKPITSGQHYEKLPSSNAISYRNRTHKLLRGFYSITYSLLFITEWMNEDIIVISPIGAYLTPTLFMLFVKSTVMKINISVKKLTSNDAWIELTDFRAFKSMRDMWFFAHKNAKLKDQRD